jgi:oligoendopeptidase F
MSNITIGQLEVLAEKLATIKDQIKILKEREDKMREEAFKLLLETGEKNIHTLHGTFTKNKGKTEKIITNLKYKETLDQLTALKAIALSNGEYTTKTGEEYLKFTSIP